MRPDVIIYGLGKHFETACGNGENLKHYNIVGHCDQNSKFSEKYSDYVHPSELSEKEYDFILITSIYYREIINRLVDTYGVDCEKIVIWDEEILRNSYFNEPGTKFAFAQFGEDYVISNILKELEIPEKQADYIEIGVDNPFKGNNTYFLHLAGARGVLIEANPESIPLIKAVRKNQIVMNKVISDKRGKIPFYIADYPSLSSLSIENIKLNHGNVKDTIFLESVTINDVLAMQSNTVVLSIDIEGYDEIVLKSIDFKRYQPKIICAEVGKPERELICYMNSKGYHLAFCNYINSIWKIDA